MTRRQYTSKRSGTVAKELLEIAKDLHDNIEAYYNIQSSMDRDLDFSGEYENVTDELYKTWNRFENEVNEIFEDMGFEKVVKRNTKKTKYDVRKSLCVYCKDGSAGSDGMCHSCRVDMDNNRRDIYKFRDDVLSWWYDFEKDVSTLISEYDEVKDLVDDIPELPDLDENSWFDRTTMLVTFIKLYKSVSKIAKEYRDYKVGHVFKNHLNKIQRFQKQAEKVVTVYG